MPPTLKVLLSVLTSGVFFAGCGSGVDSTREDTRPITIGQVEGIRSMEILLPIPPDSVVARYKRYDPATFYSAFRNEVTTLSGQIDSLNRLVPRLWRIDTLSIDHTMENFGNAASAGKTLYISSGYFYMYPDPSVLRSVVSHEFGHIFGRMLSPSQRNELDTLWERIRLAALFYLFRDGEYSGNARFGGHPEDSPAELFASCYNLFRNRSEEMDARIGYIGADLRPLVDRLRTFILHNTR